MVRLLLSSFIKPLADNLSFNPTMVRLLRTTVSHFAPTFSWFQSHNGAIAAQSLDKPLPKLNVFQSHNGAIAAFLKIAVKSHLTLVSIPQWCDCCFFENRSEIPPDASFNPTMVRLLQTPVRDARRRTVFQSHNGAIAACAQNPQKCQQNVSIPQWCDCCST